MNDGADQVRVAICVATRGRPAGLGSLLDALALVREPDNAHIIIVIVDNDPAGGSRGLVLERAAGARWPIEYHIEPQPGIPFARNAAVAACRDRVDAIVFIDDDELPEPEWLHQLLATRRQFAADVVTGPVLPRFDVPPPAWVTDGGFFDYPRFKTGTPRDTAFTNNVIVNASIFADLKTWFDERLQFTGGSDTHLFRRLHLAGYRIVWCDAAIVHDCVPPSRMTVPWLMQRSYRYGHTHAFVRMDLKQSTRLAIAGAALGKLRFAVSSLIRGVIGFRRSRLIDAGRETAYVAGMLAQLFGASYGEYATRGTSSS